MRLIACLIVAVLIALPVSGQFGPQQVIMNPAHGAHSVFAADLDGDGDADVLFAAFSGSRISWNENLGGGSFGPQQHIHLNFCCPYSVYATDLDGDGDVDVMSASMLGIFWYENLLNGAFGPPLPVLLGGDVHFVYATDLDGDGDADILSAGGGGLTSADDTIAWYENLGGAFGPQQVITPMVNGARSVYASDLDGDGDADVLSASYFGDEISWHENLGGGSFGPQQVIDWVNGAQAVFAADLDGDGDGDVLSASYIDDEIVWNENLGGGSFASQQVITTLADGAENVYAADMDGDGDMDVLSASSQDDKVAWYENLGGGTFGPQQVITNLADGATSVFAIDLDGDADADVLSSSAFDDTIAWYENLQLDCNGNGVSDAADISNGTSLDANFDGIPDECQGTWLNMGNALGHPHLSGTGPLVPGGPIILYLSNALPFSSCYLVIGFLNLNAPFKGGVLVPSPNLVLPLFTDGFGGVFLPATWPGGVPSSLSIYMQYWIPDAAGPQGFTASNALSATTP